MVRMLDREDVRTPDSGDTQVRDRLHERATPSAEEVRALVEGPRRQIRWMRWLAVLGFMVLAAGALLFVLRDGGTELTQTEPVPSGSPFDAPQRSLTEQVPDGSPFNAPLQPVSGVAVVPRSADGLEGWFEHLDPAVPRTADGAEGWIRSTTSVTRQVPDGSPFNAPLQPAIPELASVRMLPVAATTVAAGDLGLTYLPVTQLLPAVVTPEAPVVLAVQPILVGEVGEADVPVPRSADGMEGWILNLDPRVPRTADGAEGRLLTSG